MAGISFTYPIGLHVDRIPVDEHYIQILGYVSNEHLHQPCMTTRNAGGTTVQCGWPLKQLTPGGVLVTWSFAVPAGGGRGPLTLPYGSRIRVAGRPAKLHTTSDPAAVNSACYGLGAARFIEASVAPSEPGGATLFMRACLDRDAVTQQGAILAMLDSMTFTA